MIDGGRGGVGGVGGERFSVEVVLAEAEKGGCVQGDLEGGVAGCH